LVWRHVPADGNANAGPGRYAPGATLLAGADGLPEAAATQRTCAETTMREISTEIEIAASPERVWTILTDQSALPSWNPFIRSMTGRLAEGERIEVEIAPPGRSAMTFRPSLLAVKPARELRWLGSLGVYGIFDGDHAFLLERVSAHRTRFRQAERFSGLLASFIMRGDMADATCKGFIAMNDALKRRAEADD
jgi:hypothetical protein